MLTNQSVPVQCLEHIACQLDDPMSDKILLHSVICQADPAAKRIRLMPEPTCHVILCHLNSVLLYQTGVMDAVLLYQIGVMGAVLLYQIVVMGAVNRKSQRSVSAGVVTYTEVFCIVNTAMQVTKSMAAIHACCCSAANVICASTTIYCVYGSHAPIYSPLIRTLKELVFKSNGGQLVRISMVMGSTMTQTELKPKTIPSMLLTCGGLSIILTAASSIGSLSF